jgi:MoaA/NifB/PqqE/SkfB family radical SAM enzyme
MLAVTNRCNGRCRYCRIPARPADDIPLGDLLRLVDEMADAGTARLGLWGGEPLMREDIGAIVRHAKSKGMYVTMDSNGLLWREREDELDALDHVTFALDGDRAAHEANRGEGTYDRVADALERAAATAGLKVWTLTVLTKNNLGDIDAVIRTAERLKIHCAFQVLHHNDELGRNHEALLPDPEDYRAAIRHLLRRKREGAPISSSSRYLNYVLRWPDFREPTRVEPHLGLRCKAGALYCNVDADGKVYACSLLIGKVAAKNALEAGFRNAFLAIPALPCQGCSAACFTEYNYLHGLDPLCIAEWIRTTRH